MAQVQIRVDDRQLKRYLRKFPQEVPFAMKTAMNDTAFEIRNHIVKRVWPNAVQPKQRGFAGRAFRVLKATKSRLVAAVFADPSRVSAAGIEAINRVEEGIRHYPFSSRYLAVPTRNSLTRTGRLKAVAKRTLDRTEPGTFVSDMKGRGPAIWRRTRRGLQMMFVLKPSVPTPDVFPFRREAEWKARNTWPGAVRRAVIRAVKTSR